MRHPSSPSRAAGLPESNFTPRLIFILNPQLTNSQTSTNRWYVTLGSFVSQQWLNFLFGVLIGAMLTGIKRLAVDDAIFGQHASDLWRNSSLRADFSGFGRYRTELYAIGSVLLVILLFFGSRLLIKLF